MVIASSGGSRPAGPVTPAPSPVPVLRIGIVNNMPDAAFHDTNRQLVALLGQAAGAVPLDIAGYLLPDVPRHPSTVATASLPTHPFETLAEAPPHALIVTGLAPGCTQISAEPFWPQLSGLVRWAADHVPSTLLSCLAAHAAAVALHGITRVRLPTKRSGVFPHVVLPAHPLARHLGPTVAFPHSRFNAVPAAALAARGYEIVVGSDDDWSVACRRRHGRELVLLQGHPEYAPSTLLREYRRDVAEHLRGGGGGYPGLPEGYLDAEGERCLAELRARHEDPTPGRAAPPFPFRALQGHIAASWAEPARSFFRNWLHGVRALVSAPAGAEVGPPVRLPARLGAGGAEP